MCNLRNLCPDIYFSPKLHQSLVRVQFVSWWAGLLLIIHVVLVGRLAFLYSPTVNGTGHLPAGVSIWKFGRFDVYRVNPPLVKAIAALPVLATGMKQDWSSLGDTSVARPEWSIGRDFVRANGVASFWYWTLARWICIPFSVIGGYVCFRWSRELFGDVAGLAALSCWCFSPNILAYGALILPDLAATSLGLLSTWSFCKWLKYPTWSSATWAGIAMGIAELAKMTWLILFAVYPLIWAANCLMCMKTVESGGVGAPLRQLVTVIGIGLYVLNAGYAFEGSFTTFGEFTFYSQLFSGQPTGEPGNRVWGTWMEDVPVPLPRDYVTGIDLQKMDFEKGKWSFLHGEHRFGGWWYFYLYALAIKEPVGIWLLLALSIVLQFHHRIPPIPCSDLLCLLVVSLTLLTVVSSETGFSRYMRYVMPVLPFAYILGSRVFASSLFIMKIVATGACISVVVSSMWYYPYSFSYFNELIGGPRFGWRHLDSANIDFGQDIRFLKKWIEQHPNARPLYISTTTFFDLKDVGINFPEPYHRPPDGRFPPGWYVISVEALQEQSGRFDRLADFTPVDRIGYSVHVYHVQ